MNTGVREGYEGSGVCLSVGQSHGVPNLWQSLEGCPRAPWLSASLRERQEETRQLSAEDLHAAGLPAGRWLVSPSLFPKTFDLPSRAPRTECNDTETQNTSKCFMAVNPRTKKAHKHILLGWVWLER